MADDDGDGSAAEEGDCDDANAAINPDAVERCNGADDDCDGAADEEDAVDPSNWYADADEDGYGDTTTLTPACVAPDGMIADHTDCDDADAATHPAADESDCTDPHDYNCDGSIGYADRDGDGFAACAECDDQSAGIRPGAVEVCNSVDDDCDSNIDENDASDASEWFSDADEDGYGDGTTSHRQCEAPEGRVADATDCNDGDAAIHPGADEVCTDPTDYNCDGAVGYADVDGDGTPACEDCDDFDPSVHPGAVEVCDGVDDDCDGVVDPDASDGAPTFYADTDGDGFGDASNAATSCEAPVGYVSAATDCDDADAAVFPGTVDACNGADDDCDGSTDEDATFVTWYADVDDDGFGDAADSVSACAAPSGFVSTSADCADSDADVFPGALDACNDLDDDCDGTIDEDAAFFDWYADADGDGYGDAAIASSACEAPADTVLDATDCDDEQAAVYPDAIDRCDAVDNDCDGVLDEDVPVWYADDDEDGFGDFADAITSCAAPTGYIADALDCDDADDTVYPAASEACDGLDNDCDGEIDEEAPVWYTDTDGDGYGDALSFTAACAVPAGYGADATDCDDADATVHPGGSESCDGVDEDCDGTADNDPTDPPAWYRDADADTHGDPEQTLAECDQPAGYVAIFDDCDDGRAASSPDASETCNGIDDDCDASVDEADAIDPSVWYFDEDADGYGTTSVTVLACTAPADYVAAAEDCDDADADFHPGASESDCTDPLDYNCDGVTGYDDADADGWPACSECDDLDADVNPDATEVCNGVDDDCDELTDDASAADPSAWYADSDADTYGDVNDEVFACEAPTDYVADATDCDDTDALVFPTGVELCNSADDDCDGVVDDDPADEGTWYADADADLYGDADNATISCTQPADTVSNDDDCDDTLDTVSPAATEVTPDGVDNDCDGTIDEYTYSYTTDIQAIWSSECSGCHTGRGSSGSLSLNSSVSYGNIVNHASSQLSTMDRVEPLSTSDSYLFHKLEGTQVSVGGRGDDMPSTGPLSAADLAMIETWITEGAPNN